jgi:hypothetical protein
MGMGVNPYPPVYMGDPMGLFLCRGYGYGVVIPGGYLPIAISSNNMVKTLLASIFSAHSMEEADVLCDRIGIIANGSLQCIGSSKEVTLWPRSDLQISSSQ